MSIPPTDADGLAKFLAGDVDTFFGDPGGLRISAAPAKNDAGISTSPPPNSNDNPPPHQHPACVRIAELRLSLEAPAQVTKFGHLMANLVFCSPARPCCSRPSSLSAWPVRQL